MEQLFSQGIRILFFCGGETFLWNDADKTVKDLVGEAKEIGFYIVNVVTNGTIDLDIPQADLVLLSIDGTKDTHNYIRGDTFDTIMENVQRVSSNNIYIYMAVNNLNYREIGEVSGIARANPNIRAISFNFHTPYPGTEYLSLTTGQKKESIDKIASLIEQKYPVFNLKTALPYIQTNSFKTPCRQCLVSQGGKRYACGRCVEIAGLCDQCGYFFAAEYALVFDGNIRVMADMVRTYLKYI
jgi:MoaA/NifB/PqqE/SkfB family radical SAM enzyme